LDALSSSSNLIRAVVFTAIGFWLSRHYYLKYHESKSAERERNIERRLVKMLRNEGLTEVELEQVKKEILQ
jgi:hypothetical protein